MVANYKKTAFLSACFIYLLAIIASPADSITYTHKDDGKSDCMTKECHAEFIKERSSEGGVLDKTSCLDCHSAFDSDVNKNILRVIGEDLCFSCHDGMKKRIAGAKVVHPPVKDDGCLKCHRRHFSNSPWDLRVEPGELCYTCHKIFGDGIKSSPYIHEPVRMGDCTACHDPHGSEFSNLLKNLRYMPFGMGVNKDRLCYKCHNGGLAIEAVTESLTRFRNGDKNLHFRHINKPPRDRLCSTCHLTHAGPQPMFIKSELVINKPNSRDVQWRLKIKFMKTDTGGRCETGCHKVKSYDRINPVTDE